LTLAITAITDIIDIIDIDIIDTPLLLTYYCHYAIDIIITPLIISHYDDLILLLLALMRHY
jgi:hypothetical protein